MATFTITLDTTWADFRLGAGSGFSNNDDLNIDSGAVFTIDTSPDRIIGQVMINEGDFIVDGSVNDIAYIGSRAEEINANGLGRFIVNGAWKSIGTTSGVASQSITIDQTGHIGYHNYTVGLWVETGRRISLTSINTTPTVGQDAYTPQVNDFVAHTSNPNIPIGQIKDSGIDYIVVDGIHQGTVVDTDTICIVKDTKTWTLDRGLDKVWTATVNGAHVKESGVYTRWHNSAGYAKDISLYGIGWGCNTFSQSFGGAITFGDGVNGNIPPAGCDIRLPNVYFGTSNSAYTLEELCADHNVAYNIESQNAGIVSITKAQVGNAVFLDYSASEWDCYDSTFLWGFGSPACGSDSIFDNIIVTSHPTSTVNSGVYPVDTANKVTIINSTLAIKQDANYTLDFEPCAEVVVENSEIIGTNDTGNNGFKLMFTKTNKVSCKNLVTVGSGGGVDVSYASDVQLDTIYVKPFIDDTNIVGVAEDPIMLTVCTGGMIQNIFDMNSSTVHMLNDFITIVDSSNIKIRNVGLFDNPVQMNQSFSNLVNIDGLCSNIDIARCYGANPKEARFTNISLPYASGISFTDCQLDDGTRAGISIEASSMTFNNVMNAMENSDFSTATSTLLLLQNKGASGCNQLYGRYSTTKGAIYNIGQHPNADSSPYISTTNIKFSKDGKITGDVGSQLIIIGRNKIRGVISFDGEWQESTGTDTATRGERDFSTKITKQYRIDSGAWKDVTEANLLAETLDSSGFYLDVKLDWTAYSVFYALGIYYNTSDTLQKENLLPIDQDTVNFKLTGLKENSEIRVLRQDNLSEIAGVELSGTTFSFDYVYSEDILCYAVVHHENYGYIRLEVELSNTNTSIPIQQQFDRNYKNP